MCLNWPLVSKTYLGYVAGGGEGYVHTISIPDSSCAGKKTIPEWGGGGRGVMLLFTHKNGDFHTKNGAISVTKRSCAAPTFNVLRHISNRFCANIGAV